MQSSIEESAIQKKTLELCESIVSHPDFQKLRGHVESFLQNSEARDQYNALVEQSQMLEHRQQTGGIITQEEVKSFEAQRESVLKDPAVSSFLTAQQEIQTIQQFIGSYVTKTFELGRTPSEDDFSGGSCGSGCGCH
ncbi:MAG: YlbF family regulator [Verrucomicrobia bacterium]|nr:YlbF family regulator [Verrucomicrobiota bacterium]MBI3870648.1 YlbF family regulator [Verrucomicrobiota bacterium]